jgi:heparosan-N-sulfate-glucuronate 5-epimerase
MSIASRFHYYRRIFPAYLSRAESQLSFWHDVPAAAPQAAVAELGEYYMQFFEKADYHGQYDANGIPMLDYHGRIGLQYNPIAVAQWGLGNYNLFRRTNDPVRKQKFFAAAQWLRSNLEANSFGHGVWHHRFDWEYRTRLKAPWYSALAQGQGISLLVRTYIDSGEDIWLETAQRAFAAFLTPIDSGGVTFTDASGDTWFEEYIVSPPTHILNGFIWAIWGVYDYFLATGDDAAWQLFNRAVRTLSRNLSSYDLGFWSLYEQSGTALPMVASPFYHRLHTVQLRVMHRLTGNPAFANYAAKWEDYCRSRGKSIRALCYKSAFKLCYY